MALITVVAAPFLSQSIQGNETHLESRWQLWDAVPPAEGDGQGDPHLLEDTWYVADDLLSHDFDLPDDTVSAYARLQMRDNYGTLSEWGILTLVHAPPPRRTLERAWAFVLDGHVFYVLNFALEPALIYDLTTEQWHRWAGQEILTISGGTEPFWNMFRGIVWRGRVIAAGMRRSKIWELDPHSMLDEEAEPIVRRVTGFQPLRGSASVRQGALRITARKENVALPSTLVMRFSDDNGKTWSADRQVVLVANSYSQRLEFRSLGRIRAPGRLWEIEDEGGFVRIEGADADLEGEEDSEDEG